MDPKDCTTYVRVFVGGYECRLARDLTKLSLPPVLRDTGLVLHDGGECPGHFVEVNRFLIAGQWNARVVFDVEELTTRIMVDSRGLRDGTIAWDCAARGVPGEAMAIPAAHHGCYHPRVFECSICHRRESVQVALRATQHNGAAVIQAAVLTLPRGWQRAGGPTHQGLICDEHGAGSRLWQQVADHVQLDMLPPTDVNPPETRE